MQANNYNGGAFIRMEGIHKSFKSAVGEMPVLKNIHLEIGQGDFVAVIGRSGSGKSTLVNMLTGIDHPSQGSVEVNDIAIHRLNESRMSEWRGRNLGIVFQFFQLLPMLSLVENVMLPMDFCGVYPAGEREERAMQLLQRVGLEKWAHKMPGAVSGGQQQSAAVARALANDPPILVADEPTGNLDSRTAEEVMQLFAEENQRGKTVILVTHDEELAHRARRILVIADGVLIPEGVCLAFPRLPHSLLLKVAQLGKPVRFDPDAELRPENPRLNLLLITRGTLADRRGPGSLVPAGRRHVHSGAKPLEGLAYNRDELRAILPTPLAGRWS